MSAIRRRHAPTALCLLVAAGRATSGAASVPMGSGLASVPAAAALFCARPSVRSAAVCAGASLHVAYHVRLARREEEGVPSWRTEQAQTRARWAAFVLDTKGWLYAVQTLRNAITANTFLASTQISLFTLIIGFLWQSSQSPAALAARAATGEPSAAMVRLVAQFGTIATFLLCSAYQFLQSARLMTHAGFMFPVAGMESEPSISPGEAAAGLSPAAGSQGGASPPDAPAQGPNGIATPLVGKSPLLPPTPAAGGEPRLVLAVQEVMRRSELTQWAGLRFLYSAANAAVWVVGGEIAFLAAAVAMVRFLGRIDRTPAAATPGRIG